MLPEWLALGLGVAGLFALAAAALFVAGEWLFPTTRREGSGDRPGNPRRRAEIRAYLDAIGERYAEDATVAGETVAFLLPERGVAVTFDPRVYFRLRGTDTHAVLAEVEMPGAGLGARLPFEVPDVESGARDDPGGVPPDPADPAWAFDRLGLEPGASSEAIRRAYREQVKGAHPDHGGDPEQFRRLREAYTTARDHPR